MSIKTAHYLITAEMKEVLIALDYGLSAQKIAKKGFELANAMNAKVTLLHVVAD
jgi:hypothetical protein